ncbi:MAG: TetR-like C-terminal domain-containing protein [Mycobacteriales bacterium]
MDSATTTTTGRRDAGPPGRQEPDETGRAVLDATLALCRVEPPVRIDLAAITARSGVTEQDVLARWPSAEAVLLDALRGQVAPALVFPDTGDFAADLRAQLVAIAEVFADPAVGPRLVGLAAAASRDPVIARAFAERVFRPNRMLSRRRFEQAREAGQVRSEVDVDTGIDLAFGPLWFRLLLGTAPLSADYAAAVAELALGGLGATGGAG